jgi:hypothetical protein
MEMAWGLWKKIATGIKKGVEGVAKVGSRLAKSVAPIVDKASAVAKKVGSIAGWGTSGSGSGSGTNQVLGGGRVGKGGGGIRRTLTRLREQSDSD